MTGSIEQPSVPVVLTSVNNSYPVDPNFTYALPSTAYPTVVVVHEGQSNKYNAWEIACALIALFLCFTYVIHFVLSIPLAGLIGAFGVMVVVDEQNLIGLVFFLEWLIPLGFFAKVLACISILIGLRATGNNNYLKTGVIMHTILILPEIIYGILISSAAQAYAHEDEVGWRVILILTAVFSFVAMAISVFLIFLSCKVMYDRKATISTVPASLQLQQIEY